MGLFTSFDISGSGMSAQRLRSDIISQNIANVSSTSSQNGEAYRRKTVVFTEKNPMSFGDVLMTTAGTVGSGVKVTKIVEDHETPMSKVYDPAHPDADDDGYVTYPNVNVVTEMTNLIDASRAFETNVTAFNATKSMAVKGLEIGQ